MPPLRALGFVYGYAVSRFEHRGRTLGDALLPPILEFEDQVALCRHSTQLPRLTSDQPSLEAVRHNERIADSQSRVNQLPLLVAALLQCLVQFVANTVEQRDRPLVRRSQPSAGAQVLCDFRASFAFAVHPCHRAYDNRFVAAVRIALAVKCPMPARSFVVTELALEQRPNLVGHELPAPR